MHAKNDQFMQLAIELSRQSMDSNAGGPFGAVITKDGHIIATGINTVPSANDPTAHAEITAIKQACQKLSTYDLTGCELYASCEPCPMCLGAIYWASISTVYYASTRDDAAGIGFDDSHIYQELTRSMADRKVRFYQLMQEEALEVLRAWSVKPDKARY